MYWRATNYLSVGQIMVMMNDLDRFHLVMDVIDQLPQLGGRAARVRRQMVDRRLRACAYTREHGEALLDVSGWVWPHGGGV